MPIQPDDVDALIRALDGGCASATEIVVANAGMRVRAELRRLLDPGQDVAQPVRVAAIHVAGRLQLEGVVEAIDRLLPRLDAQERVVAADALGRIGGAPARAVLRGLMQDQSSDVRRFTAIAFGRVSTAETRQLLQEMRARDADPVVQDAIERILESA